MPYGLLWSGGVGRENVQTEQTRNLGYFWHVLAIEDLIIGSLVDHASELGSIIREPRIGARSLARRDSTWFVFRFRRGSA